MQVAGQGATPVLIARTEEKLKALAEKLKKRIIRLAIIMY